MKLLLNQIILKKESQILKDLSFLKFYTSNNENIILPKTSSPYSYLVLEGEIQFPTLEKYKQGEYFISEITTPDAAKILQKPFYALSLEFTNDEIISVMLEIEGKT